MEKTAINTFFSKIISWIKSNPVEFWILIGILLVAAFCRLYKIDQYMTFLGDEGRDVIIVRRLLVQGHPPLIGPGTSIGNMYLGPMYYYMMAIPLLLANFNPMGPAIQIALLGIATVWFVWFVGREWFGKTAGLVAAGLYAIAPTVIIYSRSSWNPNIMPFFALLSMYAIWKVWMDNKFGWLIVLGFSYAAVLQSHYLGLLLSPTIFIFWLLTIYQQKKKGQWKDKRREFWKKTLLGILILLGLMSPLLIFDARHNWINSKAMYEFFTIRQTTVSIKPWNAIPKTPEILNQAGSVILTAGNTLMAGVATAIFLLAFAILIYIIIVRKDKLKLINPAYFFLLSWIAFSVVGFGLYKQNIYAHYFGFVFVVPFFLVGALLSAMFERGKLLKYFGAALLIYLVVINLLASPLRKEPNKLLQRSEDVSHKIVDEANGQPMNLAVIADNNYEAGYQYFVDLFGGKVLEIDAQDQSTFANQLFVVCELIPNSKCDPTHNPKAQIANFGWSKVDAQWQLDGVIIYKLVHSQ